MPKKTKDERTPLKAGSINVFTWVDEVKEEWRKITWTSRDDLIFYVKLVVSTMVVSGLVVYLMDLTVHSILDGILNILQWIGG